MGLLEKIRETFTDDVMPSYIYTYPTKSAYQPFTDWKRACGNWSQVIGPIALYIHIPFCEMKCSFCDLFTVINQPQNIFDRYVRAIVKEMEIMKSFMKPDQITVQSVYFGGGTPSLLNEAQISSIIEKVKNTFPLASNAEWSIEGAPNSFTEEKFQQWKNCGINRLSIGIQTFDKEELKSVGRFYPAELGYEMAKAAVHSGIKNINLDLIYGIPGQTFAKWKANLQKAVEIGPLTITAYPLVLRGATAFGRQKERQTRSDFIESRIRYEWLDYTFAQLIENGYRQHTLVTFAKQNGGCQHEANEFLGLPTLSFGAGSRKYAPDIHYVDEDYRDRKPHKITMMEYMSSIEQDEIAVKSAVHLTRADQILRYFILGLLSQGVDTKQFDQKFHDSIENCFPGLLQAFQEEGFIRQADPMIKLTPKGIRFSSHIGHFIMNHFGGDREPASMV